LASCSGIPVCLILERTVVSDINERFRAMVLKNEFLISSV
jgi:hypothetical protein